MSGEHLNAHLFTDGHWGLLDLSVNIINGTDVAKPTEQDVF